MRVFLLSFFLVLLVSSDNNQEIIYSNSFETDPFLQQDNIIESCCPGSVKSTNEVFKTGKKSLRFELNDSDPIVSGGKRSEMVFRFENSPNIERWYKFYTYFPRDYKSDPLPEIIAQWHEIPDWDLGETWRSPPISLQTKNGVWSVVVLWASEKVNTYETISGRKAFELGNVKAGVWDEWIFHIKFSYQNDGVIQLWRAGKLVLDYKGPNYYNDEKGPYFKMGIYKWEWNNYVANRFINQRVLFIDDVIIGNENANLKILRK